MSLLDDLREGERETRGEGPCPACELVAATEDEETREYLIAAFAGSIGINKLAAIMQRNETGVGHRTITRHRKEGHNPT